MYTLLKQKVVKRPWGTECRFTAIEPGSPDINEVIQVKEGVDVGPVIAARLNQIDQEVAAERAYSENKSNIFDSYGDELRGGVSWVIRTIRDNPSISIKQLETKWGEDFADSLIPFSSLAAKLQADAGDLSWPQFKTYVTSRKFDLLDQK